VRPSSREDDGLSILRDACQGAMKVLKQAHNPAREWPFGPAGRPDLRQRGRRARAALAIRAAETSTQPAVPARSRKAGGGAQRGDLFAWSATAKGGENCCWYRCANAGQPYRVSGIFVRTVRHYCKHHVCLAECAGLRLAPFELRDAQTRNPEGPAYVAKCGGHRRRERCSKTILHRRGEISALAGG
jgi:hypothetical protein